MGDHSRTTQLETRGLIRGIWTRFLCSRGYQSRCAYWSFTNHKY